MSKGIKLAGCFFSVFLFSSLAHSNTYCESSRIDRLTLVDGPNSEVRIVTVGAHPDFRKLNSTLGYATTIRYDNGTRFDDRLSLLKLAFALELPVSIWSSDDNCMGPSDKFSITICQSTGCDRID